MKAHDNRDRAAALIIQRETAAPPHILARVRALAFMRAATDAAADAARAAPVVEPSGPA
jgi:hypothetical protein